MSIEKSLVGVFFKGALERLTVETWLQVLQDSHRKVILFNSTMKNAQLLYGTETSNFYIHHDILSLWLPCPKRMTSDFDRSMNQCTWVVKHQVSRITSAGRGCKLREMSIEENPVEVPPKPVFCWKWRYLGTFDRRAMIASFSSSIQETCISSTCKGTFLAIADAFCPIGLV